MILPSIALIIVIGLSECSVSKSVTTADSSGRKPGAEREFRAAWVATVDNINWPSKPGLPVEQQKKEAMELLEAIGDPEFIDPDPEDAGNKEHLGG